jgi:hypothetical protein
MTRHLSCALAASILLSTPSIVTADPITFDFSGTLNSPVNGSNQFSGSFTINADPTVSPTNLSPPYSPYWISENGNNVSLTVTLGGQVTNYINTTEYPNLAALAVSVNPSTLPAESNPSGDVVTVGGVPAYSDPGYNPGFWLGFSSPTETIFSQLGPNNVANLRNFNFSAAAAVDAQYTDAQYTNASGVIDRGIVTSIEEVAAPEPSTLVVFAMLGLAAIVHQRYCKSSRDPIAQ